MGTCPTCSNVLIQIATGTTNVLICVIISLWEIKLCSSFDSILVQCSIGALKVHSHSFSYWKIVENETDT